MKKVEIIKKQNGKIYIHFVSKSFLQQQVRSMVGCIKYLGEGKWSLKKFTKVFKSKKKKNNVCTSCSSMWSVSFRCEVLNYFKPYLFIELIEILMTEIKFLKKENLLYVKFIFQIQKKIF